MEKKKYTKPTIVKVELNHEQAVLGACSADSATTENSDSNGYCKPHGGCKANTSSGGTDTDAIS